MRARSSVAAGAAATLVSAALIAAATWHLTAGLACFTSESWRRASVAAHPRAVPAVRLQDHSGQTVSLRDLCDRTMVIDFVYTRCPAVCRAFGASSALLARRLGEDPRTRDALVLSISFDPLFDTPERLNSFKRAMESQPGPWRLARPLGGDALARLTDAFGIVAIPDGFGGFDHNAALHVVDRSCRLVRVLDADDVDGAADAVRALARQDP